MKKEFSKVIVRVRLQLRIRFAHISPLNTPPTDAAPEIWLHDSAKVQGSLNMEEKSTVNGAEELESGARKKIPTEKGKQYEIQRLKDRKLWLFAT